MEGVDQDGTRAQREQGRRAAEETGLGGVRMDEVGPEAAGDAPDLQQGPRIVQRVDRLPEAREVDGARALALGQVRHRLLSGGRPAVHQEGLVAIGIEAATAQQARLVRGPPEVHAGDHPQDPDSAQLRRSLVRRRSPPWAVRGEVSSSAMIAAPAAT